MKNLFAKASLALALGATALTVAAPAEAQRYNGGHRGRDNGGAVIVAGIAGLAIGAALASSGNHRRDGYYEQDYDRGPGYDPYYQQYQPAYDQGYYDQGYYVQRGYARRDGYRGRDYRRDGRHDNHQGYRR
ncbi:MAG: hypothetical protein JWN66_3819 [Sphingomonas bacterium]|uniref:hypothetical protein n=1 Tax=Sphingomonas bacterium TaxID=1895847 RepID=UPI0026098D5F|nr:hypothetical protein [Sphingomonas bacterium]MDB5706703.1 hypothetical protein [Sphingomonas bacterium]